MFTGPHIVTDGLVLSLDAGNNKSYQSGSTTWFDRSGNGNNGTLTNGPTFSSQNQGSIVFDGVNDYVLVGNQPSLSLTTFTLAAWIRTTTSTNQIILGKSHLTSYYMNTANGGFSLWTAGSTLGSVNIGLNDGNWHYVVATMVGTLKSLYADGRFITSNNGTIPTIDNAILYIGLSASVNIHFNGNIAQTQIYNRALTPQEILQNYNATKSRFNL